MNCECGSGARIKWGILTAINTTAGTYQVRFAGDTVAVSVGLLAAPLTEIQGLAAGNKIWLVEVAAGQWALAGRLRVPADVTEG